MLELCSNLIEYLIFKKGTVILEIFEYYWISLESFTFLNVNLASLLIARQGIKLVIILRVQKIPGKR